MTDQELRLSQLQQIPLFALRNKLIELAQNATIAEKLAERFQNVLELQPRKLEGAIKNCSRTQLVRLIRVCPEIRPDEITQLFREYRYGTNPSFHLFQFDAANLDSQNELDVLMDKLGQNFKSLEAFQDGRMITGLDIIEMLPMSHQTGIIESNFRYLMRLDYVDSDEEAISTYETIYGFFWINYVDGYVTIHASAKEIREVIKLAIEKSLGRILDALRLPKELQKMIPFLGEDSMTYGRLYNPDPNSPIFTSLAIKDENLLAKGYQQYENAYSNVRQAHYKDKIGDNSKKTTIVVSERGSLRVYGKHTASQFRDWCLERLRLIVRTLQTYRASIDSYISSLDFQHTNELDELGSEKQRSLVIRFASILAALKRFPGVTQYPSGISALEVANSFGEMLYLRIPFSCQLLACEEEGCLTCPICNSRRLIVRDRNGWVVECPKHLENPFSRYLPIEVTCEQLHVTRLGQTEIENSTEIFFGRKLLRIVSNLLKLNIPDVEVDFNQELIYLWGSNLVFHPKKTRNLKDCGDTYNVIVKNSKATAIGPGSSASYGN